MLEDGARAAAGGAFKQALARRAVVSAIAISIAGSVCGQASAKPGDELCRQLTAFETAPFEKGGDAKPLRRSVEFRWPQNWLTGGMWGCRNTKGAAAKSFCAYLVDHTNQEFPVGLPFSILSCYGYVFPPPWGGNWDDWTANIRLRGHQSDRNLILEVYFPDRSAKRAVRISAVPYDASSDDKEPLALRDTAPLPGAP